MSSGTVALGGVALPIDSVPARRGVVHPLGLERYEVRFMARPTLREKLRLAQDLLAHAVPSADLAEVVERGVTLLIEDLSRRKFAATDRPRRSQVRARVSTYVPAEVRRTVWRRDGGRCAFVAQSSRRCDARRLLEFHHVIPRAAGGKASVENIQLRCRAHNGHEVDLFFGPGKRYLAERAGTRPGSSTAGWAGRVPGWARTPSP